MWTKVVTSLALATVITGCLENEWQCGNGECISASWHCDSVRDCADNSDEENCALAAPQGGGVNQLIVEAAPQGEDYLDYYLNFNFCPAPNGYFADPFQCDKYYECIDGVPTENICPDGQGFLEGNPSRAQCEYLFNVNCTLRPDLPLAAPQGGEENQLIVEAAPQGGGENQLIVEAAPQGGGENQLIVEAAPQGEDYLDVNFCPAPNGYFADPLQCDKYYKCIDGVPTENICPDGQGFLDGNPSRAQCEYLFNVNCTLRPDLQPASPSPNCPRANGYFAHMDETICDEFYYCANNVDAKNVCPAGLHFSKFSGNCAWKAQAKRTGCDKKKDSLTTFGNSFECPVVDQHAAVAHPRYQNPADCRNFFVCFNGVGPPRDSGCDLGLVFSETAKACVTPNQVPECSTYYNEYFELYFSTLFGAKADTEHIQQALILGIPVPAAARPPAFGQETTKKPFKAKRRRRTTTTTTTTTTPAPAEYEYEYYYDESYYYDEDNSTITTTTTTTTPAPKLRRRPPSLSRRRPSRPSRRRETEQAEGGN